MLNPSANLSEGLKWAAIQPALHRHSLSTDSPFVVTQPRRPQETIGNAYAL
jgi:hypothetical protein